MSMPNNGQSEIAGLQYKVIFDEQQVEQIWGDFTLLGLDLMEKEYDKTGRVPTSFSPMVGGFMPVLRILEGAYERSIQSAKWGEIWNQITQKDENGFRNLIFTVKVGERISYDGTVIEEHMFSRRVEDVNSPVIYDDIADKLKTYNNLARIIDPDIQMCAATCKGSTDTYLKQRWNKNIHVPTRGVMPFMDDEDPWAYNAFGMNRFDDQSARASAYQRASGICYTMDDCPAGGDLPLLLKSIPQDSLVERYAQKGAFVIRSLYELDRAKIQAQALQGSERSVAFEHMLKLAQEHVNYYVQNMPCLVA